jgi:adhesin transport system outer membrane protein
VLAIQHIKIESQSNILKISKLPKSNNWKVPMKRYSATNRIFRFIYRRITLCSQAEFLKYCFGKPFFAFFCFKYIRAAVCLASVGLAHAESLEVAGTVPVLEPLIASALSSHPSQKSQILLLQSAQAGIDIARWQFYPTPSLSIEQAGASPTDPSYQGASSVKRLSLQQPLWTGGRLTAGLQKAKANVSVSQASVEEVRQQLALRVLQNYGEWMAAFLKTRTHEKSTATHDRLHAIVKRRIEQGVAPKSDSTLVIARLESLASDTAVLRAQQGISLARLGQLVGHPVLSSELALNLAIPYECGSELPILLDKSLVVSPSLLKARSLAKVQESVVAERRADVSPEVYLRAEQQYGNFFYRNAPSESRLFIGVTSHFGAGLSSLSGIDGAKSMYLAALEEVEAQGRIVSEQVFADYTLSASSQGRMVALQAALKAAVEVSQSYDRQFLAGRKTWLDVMNATRELAQIEVQLADIESTRVIATWRLAIYSQGLNAVLGVLQ